MMLPESDIPGLLFTLTEAWLLERDEALMERVLRRAGQDLVEPWVDGQTYPYSELQALYAAIAAESGGTPEPAARAFGAWAAPVLLRRYNALVAGLTSPLELLETLEPSIGPQLSRMLGFSSPGEFLSFCREGEGGTLRAPAAPLLAGVVHGLLEGMSAHFGTSVQVEAVALADGAAPRLALRFGAAA